MNLDHLDRDTQSLLIGTYAAALVHALAFVKHLERHRDELSPAMRQRMTDDALTLLEAIRNFQCETVRRGARPRPIRRTRPLPGVRRQTRGVMVYYNEHDPFAAAWLRELVKAQQIAEGEVDERDIQDVTAGDVRGFTQCHFFAGIGGWSLALRLAGWPDDRPVWTGSCPCQPFSAAGTRDGGADPRHLWPHWARLIRECAPVTIFGEQVESAIAHGWLDAVFDDLEREGYACGAACLPAASVGAFHIRQRVWFVADRDSSRFGSRWGGNAGDEGDAPRLEPTGLRDVGDLADDDEGRRSEFRQTRLHADGPSGDESARRRASHWAGCDWITCRDGKIRPTEPSLFPLAHGVSGRVGRLRGYGNAIVPQVAAEVIRAYLEV